MKRPKSLRGVLCAGAALLSSYYAFAQQEDDRELAVPHSECAFLGPKQSHFARNGLAAQARHDFEFSRLTSAVASRLPASTAPKTTRSADTNNVIDRHLSQAWIDASITPALKTDDFNFIRRVTLDLTGRVPTAARVQQFVADLDSDKRTKLIDELLGSPEFVDKWTMYFGDMLKNTVRTTQVVRYNDGRNAFYEWIKQSVADNKPYNQLVSELISATGTNSYQQGSINWVVGGFVTGGPQQDIYDQQASNTVQTFLGVSHFNCVMCHDGRRHLDTLSLWGKNATRYSAYQVAAFYAKTVMSRTPVTPGVGTPYYWGVQDNNARTDYALNTTTGNRPTRSAVGTLRVVTPEYSFNEQKANPGEPYRAALARLITNDTQFARAAVNYIWKEFMVKGFVEPADQFDLARLDPDNPPEAPWTIQPNQPRLLNALAQEFIGMKYDLRALMRTIVTSEAYQLSSRYNGEWNPAWENFYARKLVRRMWGEEVHDAILQTSNVTANYNVAGFGIVNRAMKLPDPTIRVAGDFLDSFMRGNRDTEERRSDGSTLQALNLMNDTLVMSRTRATGTGANASLLRTALTGTTDEQLVSMLYINVLSRYPTDVEKASALSYLKSGTRQQKAEDLLWSLYNKVDFFFNY